MQLQQAPRSAMIGVRGLPARGILSLGVMGLGPGQFEGFVFRLFFFLKVRGQLDNLLRSWTTYYGVGRLTTELDALLRSWTAYYGVGQLTTELDNLLRSWTTYYGVGQPTHYFDDLALLVRRPGLKYLLFLDDLDVEL